MNAWSPRVQRHLLVASVCFARAYPDASAFWVVCWFGVCFVRAENAFWPSLLQLAAQVLVPGVGDVASAQASRAASAVGRFSPNEK